MTRTKRHSNNGLRKVCTCPRRSWPKCDHSWYFNFKPRGGAPYRFALDKHFNRRIDSKSEAEDLAADLRKSIRAGTFGQPAPIAAMTVRQLVDTYVERYVRVERSATEQSYVWALNKICRTEVPRPTGGRSPLGEWPIGNVTTDTIERFREIRRAEGAGLGGTNRHLARLRAVFAWAVRVGYADRTPFRRGSEPVVKLAQEPKRARRLNADLEEERTLLAVCHPHLRNVVECALETGMRRGEILSLRWREVEGVRVEGSTVTWALRAELALRAANTKTRRHRRIPISSRLKSVLAMRAFDPAGKPMPADAFVFGDRIGQQVKSVDRAWEAAVLKAHGQTPKYTKTANLTPESRAALAAIDLHFHDLRREAGSRWLEGGVPLHTVRDWLGHTSIAQTSTYLAGTLQTQHDAMKQFEARRADLQRLATDAGTGGRKGPQTAAGGAKKANETAGRLEPTIM